MNSKRIISAIALVAVLAIYWFQQKQATVVKDDEVPTNTQTSSNFNFLPSSTTGQVVQHEAYALSYSEPHEQAEWIAYKLEKNDIVNTNRKRPFFISDPKVKTKSAHYKNYKNSGYDRGHLCPAGDRKEDDKEYKQTFYTSNISPQKHSFNAGIWNRLEQKTRYWAQKNKQIYVITGGILEDNLKTIGKDKVAIPKEFYKILLDYTKPEIKAIAFLMPHKDSNKPLYDFVVSIDAIEAKTGIDFFPNLPDNIENKLEASSNYKNWSF